jgi:GNAT superfamily N-acetyltransferase
MLLVSYSIICATQSEFKEVFGWAAKEGWNPGKYDLAPYFMVDPQGFYILSFDGKSIASISAIRYPQDLAFVGFYIVRPEYRGQGYGVKLWSHVMSGHLKDNSCLALYAVLSQVDTYVKIGFKSLHKNIRWVGDSSVILTKFKVLQKEGLKLITADVVKEIARFEAAQFSLHRPDFFKKLCANSDTYGLAVIKEGALQGFGFIRPCCKTNSYRLGPLYAVDFNMAIDLVRGLVEKIGVNKTFIIDMPEINLQNEALAQYLQFKRDPAIDTILMYKGCPFTISQNVYAVASLDIG